MADNLPEPTEKRREIARRYYEKNREKILEYSKEYAKSHKDDIKKYNAKYYETHKEEILCKHKQMRPVKEKKEMEKEKKIKKSKLPKEYFVYEKKDERLESMKPHLKKKLLELCPKGFYEVENKNPFRITFD